MPADSAIKARRKQQPLFETWRGQETRAQRSAELSEARGEAELGPGVPECGGPFAAGPRHRNTLHEIMSLALPSGLQHAARRQKEQPIGPRVARRLRQVRAEQPATPQDTAAGCIRHGDRTIVRAAIDDDHLADGAVRSRRHQRSERVGQRNLIIPDGKDHTDHFYCIAPIFINREAIGPICGVSGLMFLICSSRAPSIDLCPWLAPSIRISTRC